MAEDNETDIKWPFKTPDDFNEKNVPWHLLYYYSFKLMLRSSQDYLDFVPENQITVEPQRIDLTVVYDGKKPIPNNIAAIFRHYNILEFTGPGSYLNFSAFAHAIAHYILYALQTKIKEDDLSLTLVTRTYPKSLIKYLENYYKFEVKKKYDGIYWLGGFPLAIQIVVQKELTGTENSLLKIVTNDLTHEDILNFKGAVSKDDPMYKTYQHLIDAIIRANIKVIREVFEMNQNIVDPDLQALIECVMGPNVITDAVNKARVEAKAEGKAEGIAEGIEEGKAQNSLKIAKKMIKLGYALEEIAKLTSIPQAKLKKIMN